MVFLIQTSSNLYTSLRSLELKPGLVTHTLLDNNSSVSETRVDFDSRNVE